MRHNTHTPYPDWYKAVCREVRRRAEYKCEHDNCTRDGMHIHHVIYPATRRETPNDLMFLCEWHHFAAHHPGAANDNDPNQLKMKFG